MNPKLSLLLGICCISFSPIFVVIAGAPPVTSAFYRIFIGWICVAAYCIPARKTRIRRRELLITVAGGLVFAADIGVWNLSLTKISATVSTLLANLAPVWVGLLSFILFRKKAGNFFWLGTGIAILGMVILVGFQALFSVQLNIGIWFALLASLLYAIYILITQDILQKISTLTFMFYNMMAASIFLLLISWSLHNNLHQFSIKAWFCFAGLGLICQLIGWLTINHSLRFLDSTKVSVALLAQTVLAAFWSMLILNEKLGMHEVLGTVVILGGIALTFIKRQTVSI